MLHVGAEKLYRVKSFNLREGGFMWFILDPMDGSKVRTWWHAVGCACDVWPSTGMRATIQQGRTIRTGRMIRTSR